MCFQTCLCTHVGKLLQYETVARISGDEACKHDLFRAFQDEADRVWKDEDGRLFLHVRQCCVTHLDLCSTTEHRLLIEWRVEIDVLVCYVEHSLQ